VLIWNEKEKAPSLYMPENAVTMANETISSTHIPSSGVIVRVKLRRSAGSGKFVFMVEGRSSSVRSETM
jgi:hypothetical protein